MASTIPPSDEHSPETSPGTGGSPSPGAKSAAHAKLHGHGARKWLILAGIIAVLAVGGYLLAPDVIKAFNTVSTDDAYVDGHVTFVAPRVSGQVTKVFVDDNYRVKKGDLLVQLDKTPYEVQVAVKTAAAARAEADLAAAKSQVSGQAGAVKAARFALQHAMETVDTQVADLRAAVATLNSAKATLDLAKANQKRGEDLAPTGGISREELDIRRQQEKVDEAAVDQALQQIEAIRVGLGLPAEPANGQSLTDVPPNLDQDYSAVRQDLGTLLQTASQLGYFPAAFDQTPQQVIDDFYKQDPQGDLNRIMARLVANAPAIKQAETSLLQAQSDLDQARLNLSYCDVVSEIDGVVVGRNINPGNNVQIAQNLLSVRSLTEIWINANFKETQLVNLRIGAPVRCEVDMYGGNKEFEGRISGFTMGTGQTLSLLPPQNATGNYVKIVQRLPVRIELTDYDPEKNPLFVGLSVTPYVYFKETPTGPHAGEVFQPLADLPTGPTDPKP